jgi:hypothetical protein
VAPDAGYHLLILPLDLSDPDKPKPGPAEPFVAAKYTAFLGSFSPDGRWIAYTAAGLAAGNPIFVRPFPPTIGGQSPQWQISTDGGAAPRWSRGSRELFFTRGAQIMVAGYTVEGRSFVAGKPRPWSKTPFRQLQVQGTVSEQTCRPTANDSSYFRRRRSGRRNLPSTSTCC